MSFWPKSRYVVSLEQQVADLREQLAQERAAHRQTLLWLQTSTGLNPRPTRQSEIAPGSVVGIGKHAHPLPVNLMRAKEFLESAKTPIFEGTPDKEN